PGQRHVAVVPLDPAPPARPVGLGRAGIADVDQLRIEVQLPQRQRALQPRQPFRPQAELHPPRLDKTWHRIDGIPAARVDPRRHAARVVAVEAPTRVDEELGLRPGAEHQRELRRHQRRPRRAGVLHLAQAVHAEARLIRAHADHRARPGRQLHAGLAVDPDQRLPHAIVARGADHRAGLGVEQADPCAVLSQLHPELAARRQSAQRVVDRVAGAGTVDLAVVLLRELVAGVRPLHRVGEIRVQRQLVAHRIGGDAGAGALGVARPFARQAAAARAAAVGGIDGVEAPEGSALEAARVDQALRHLVRRGPVRAVVHQPHAPAVLARAAGQAQHQVAPVQGLGELPGAVVAHRLDGAEQLHPRAHL
ncbi:conserved hypothetical protein, partial [Ricinus communis]